MIDPEEVQVSLSVGEDPVRNDSEINGETGRAETTSCVKRLRSSWYLVLIAILMVVILAVGGVFFSEKNEKQSLEAKLQHLEGEFFAAKINIDELQKENNLLKQVLYFINQNFTIVENDGQLKLLINASLLLAEKTQLSQNLERTMQEKTQLQVENEELNMLLTSTKENCSKEEERLQNEKNQIEIKSQQQHSILFASSLSFLWKFCNNDTLECSRCLPNWTEHASRCFFISSEAMKWENARWECVNMGGDLAVVLDVNDQVFLTNMTYQYKQQNPEFLSAWIGMQDMVNEGTYYWINGNRIRSDLVYWRPLEPNNNIADWDIDMAGQDCVAIVPPDAIGGDWLNSWDDIVCLGARHYICETKALILT